MQCGFILELLSLLLKRDEALPQPGNAGFKLLFVNQPLGVAVDQPGKALPQLPDLGVERGLRLPLRASGGMQPTAIFLGEALRMSEQRAHFLPHGQIQQIGADLRIGADALPPKAVGICAQTAIIGIRPRVPFGGLVTDGFPVKGIATVVTLHQALQQIPRATA